MRKVIGSGFILLLLCALGSPALAMPTQWAQNGHYYDLVTADATWDTANQLASSMTYNGLQGHLATITSSAENAFITSLIGCDVAWLGGFQAKGSQEPYKGWSWVTGETWNYSNWAIFEPNDFLGQDSLQMFGKVFPLAGKWNDLNGLRSSLDYVVEYDGIPVVPEPSTFLLLGVGFAIMGLALHHRKTPAGPRETQSA